MSAPSASGPDPDLIRLLMAVRLNGVTDPRVLAALERTDRRDFLPPGRAAEALQDTPSPLAEGYLIPSPTEAARFADALNVREEHKVMEVGAGSLYQAAILSRLARRVYAIERDRVLFDGARALSGVLGLANVIVRHGDGLEGWIEQAPFDRIVISAGLSARPDRLLGELTPQGILVAPIFASPEDAARGTAILTRYRRALGPFAAADGIGQDTLGPIRATPAQAGIVHDLR